VVKLSRCGALHALLRPECRQPSIDPPYRRSAPREESSQARDTPRRITVKGPTNETTPMPTDAVSRRLS